MRPVEKAVDAYTAKLAGKGRSTLNDHKSLTWDPESHPSNRLKLKYECPTGRGSDDQGHAMTYDKEREFYLQPGSDVSEDDYKKQRAHGARSAHGMLT